MGDTDLLYFIECAVPLPELVLLYWYVDKCFCRILVLFAYAKVCTWCLWS